METVTTPTDTAKPRARCMTCGGVAWRSEIRRDRVGVLTGWFMCAEYHLWLARWIDPTLTVPHDLAG